MGVLLQKLQEVLLSVVPIFLIVLSIHLFFVPLEAYLLIRFIIGTVFITLGLTLFLLGVDLGVTTLGANVGEKIVKMNKLWIIVLAGLVLGFVITVAEPGLLVYAQQIELVTGGALLSTVLLFVVSTGIALLLVVGFMRIIYNIPLHYLLTVLYGVVFLFAIFTPAAFINIAFDASGATTGVLSVPFILSLAYGISHLKKDSKAGEKDSFGTIAIVSAGAIIAVLVMNLFVTDFSLSGEPILQAINSETVWGSFSAVFIVALSETFFSLVPIILVLMLSQFLLFKMKTRQFIHIIKGFIYVFLGLVLFLLGVNGGFLDVGFRVGQSLIATDQHMMFLIIAFMIGVVTILAEPAVHVLTASIDQVTSGYVSRVAVLVTLSIGVGLAVFLSALRIFIEPLQVWHYLLPGYIIAVALMYIVPKIFVGIAYDAGGVATGPMTATFILAFMYGATDAYPQSSILLDGLGTIALVALTPILTLQVLGLIYKWKTRKGGLTDES